MSTSGRFRFASRVRAFEAQIDPRLRSARRAERIVRSLRAEIVEGGTESLRLRQIFHGPREIFRLEFEWPSMGYQRTTLLDRSALDELLAVEEVRALIRPSDLREIH